MTHSLTSKIEEANAVLIVDGDLDRIAEFFTLDYTLHLTNNSMEGGYDLVRKALSALRISFTDIQLQIDIFMHNEDRVAWQRTFHATHQAKFKGFNPSGRHLTWRDMVVSRFHDDRIAEEWLITDLAEQLLGSAKRAR